MPATAAPDTSSTIGLKNLVIAPLTADTDAAITYGTVQKVAGAIEVTVTPDNADPDTQYADDGEFDNIYPDPEMTLGVKLVDIPLSIQAMIFNEEIDDNGVLVKKAGEKSPYFAVGFSSEKSDGNDRYVWLYKCRAKQYTQTYATKEGSSITRQEPTVEFAAIKRTHDDMWQSVADVGSNGFTAAKAATFLDTVYTPSFT